MSSSINYTAIDEDYPVPGQDNNSQGFRDNFSAIKNGLQFAKTEIEELQNKAVLKEAVGETELENDFLGNTILNAITNRVDGSVYTATPAGASSIVTPSSGDYQKFTFVVTGHQLKFSGWPNTGTDRFSRLRLELVTDGGTCNLTFGSIGGGVIRPLGNLADPISLTVTDVPRILDVWTIDAGANIYVAEVPGVGGAGTTPALEDLPDTLITTPINNQILKYNADLEKWINSAVIPDTQLTGLSDVTITSAAAGQVLKFNGVSWINSNDDVGTGGGTGSGATTLNELTDVILTSPVSNQLLQYNGSAWVNNPISLTLLTDIAFTSPTSGQVLKFDSASGDWKNVNEVTYDVVSAAGTELGSAKLKLDAANEGLTVSPTDSFVEFVGGHGITIDPTSVTTITINSTNFKEYTVTIEDDGDGAGQDIFFIDGIKITEKNLKFTPGWTYKFNISGITNLNRTLKFSTTADDVVNPGDPSDTTTDYTTNVTSVGIAGVSGAYVEIIVTSDTPNLYVYAYPGTGSPITSRIGGGTQILIGGTSTRVLVRKDYAATPNQYVVADSSDDPFTITLPANAVAGDFVSVTDNGNATTNSITINRNGKLIDGVARNLVCNSDYSAVTLVSDGTNWIVQTVAELLDTQDLVSGAVIDPRAEIVYFSTSGSETATLPASGIGRTLTLAMIADGGDMVITATNPAWGGGGTITFNAVGQACTMQYIANKWVCIGNNGATFA